MDGTNRPSEQQNGRAEDVFVNWTFDSNYVLPIMNS